MKYFNIYYSFLEKDTFSAEFLVIDNDINPSSHKIAYKVCGSGKIHVLSESWFPNEPLPAFKRQTALIIRQFNGFGGGVVGFPVCSHSFSSKSFRPGVRSHVTQNRHVFKHLLFQTQDHLFKQTTS